MQNQNIQLVMEIIVHEQATRKLQYSVWPRGLVLVDIEEILDRDLMTKRVFDFFFSIILLVLLSPLLVIIAFFVFMSVGKPVLFKQLRPGLHGKPFILIKFRTMVEGHRPDGTTLPDNKRLTRFGKLLRSTSLDEVPALWNVVKGEMSLVGPRPLLMDYLPLYSLEHARRHSVRPGITGWAQVNGRNAISWNEKFTLDVWYVEHQSIWLDTKILFMTVKQVLLRHGINADGETTMPRFDGKN